MDISTIKQTYRLTPASEHRELLYRVSHRRIIPCESQSKPKKGYLGFLAHNGVSGPEKADFILSFDQDEMQKSDQLPASRDVDAASYFWKWGEIGKLIPCPVVTYRFMGACHLNDQLSRSLCNQLRTALVQSESAFGDRHYVGALLQALIKHLIRLDKNYADQTTCEAVRITPAQFNQIKAYILDHLERPIQVVALARLLGISEGYFYDAFKHTTGVTPIRYITSARIEKAKALLLDSDASVSQIGMEVGFDNPSYFAKLFKKETGSSPSAFRSGFVNK